MTPQGSLDLVDTHCHLNFDVYDLDRKFVMERARENGITRILIPGVDLETSRSAIKCSWEYPEVYAAVGVHPNDGSNWTDTTLDELRDLASEEKVIAIGEIGLDYYRNLTPRAVQQSIFQQQLELAAELGLPVIVHNREASSDIVKILHEWHGMLPSGSSRLKESPGVMHSFTGDLAYAREMIGNHFMLGINGPITFQNSRALQSVVSSLPAENLLIETDAPFLAPHPYRGKRNEPANVRIVAGKLAELKAMTVDTVARITTAGADRLFRWREIH